MNSLLAPRHPVFVDVWLGCVSTEALFERALLGTGHDNERLLARLHCKGEVLVEIPALVGAVVTGGLWFARVRLAEAGDWTAFKRADRLQHKWGAVVLGGAVGALGLGRHRVVS